MNDVAHDSRNKKCPWNDPETTANRATAGLPCSCVDDYLDHHDNVEENTGFRGEFVHPDGETYHVLFKGCERISDAAIHCENEMKEHKVAFKSLEPWVREWWKLHGAPAGWFCANNSSSTLAHYFLKEWPQSLCGLVRRSTKAEPYTTQFKCNHCVRAEAKLDK